MARTDIVVRSVADYVDILVGGKRDVLIRVSGQYENIVRLDGYHLGDATGFAESDKRKTRIGRQKEQSEHR